MHPTNNTVNKLFSAAWSLADILRQSGFKEYEYGSAVLPFVVMRRIDQALKPYKHQIISAYEELDPDCSDAVKFECLMAVVDDSPVKAYNVSKLDFDVIHASEPENVQGNLLEYISKFSPDVFDMFYEKFRINEIIARLAEARTLWQFFERIYEMDLSLKVVDNHDMGYLFEDLLRQFSELSNEAAGQYFTPREVVALIVDLVTALDEEDLKKPGKVVRVYDSCCGTGGMLTYADKRLNEIAPDITVELYGQEVDPKSYAICRADMMITGHDPSAIRFGNTLNNDRFHDETFHYAISNPPYGVDWKYCREFIEEEAKQPGGGRFPGGSPRVSDGQMLFIQHLVSKLRPEGGRAGIVVNGSPLFTGGAGSGESDARRWMIENDLVEAIVALPKDLFYNTGIQTYIFILSNKKPLERKGKIQLIDASGDRFFTKMRKPLGMKRVELSQDGVIRIVQLYREGFNEGYADLFEISEVMKIMEGSEFGYREIAIERPLRLKYEISEEGLENLRKSATYGKLEDKQVVFNALNSCIGFEAISRYEFDSKIEQLAEEFGFIAKAPLKKTLSTLFSVADSYGEISHDKNGEVLPDPNLRDQEYVPLGESIEDYFFKEIEPYYEDAWINPSKCDPKDGEIGIVGYEINFNKYFFKETKFRGSDQIDRELSELGTEIAALLKDMNKKMNQGAAFEGNLVQSRGARLKHFFDIKLGKMLQSAKRDDDDQMVPYLRAANIQDGHLDTSDINKMWANKKEIKGYKLEKGDLVVVEGGEVGRACIVSSDLNSHVFQNSVHRIKSKNSGLVKLAYYWLGYLRSIGYIDNICSKATFAHLTSEKLKEIPFPFSDKYINSETLASLDKEIEKIEKLKKNATSMIDLLNEKRQITIRDAFNR